MTRQEPIRRDRKKCIWLRMVLLLAAVCFLAAGAMVWLKHAAYGAKKTIHILEISPTREQAVLGYYIGGDSIDRGIAEEKILETAKAGKTSQTVWKYFFFKADGGAKQDCLPPYTVFEEGGDTKLVNNELFKLICLKVGEYDSAKSVYENYQANQAALSEFDASYELRLTIKTPQEVTEEDIENAAYIHFDSGNTGGDIQQFDNIYKEIMGSKTTFSTYSAGSRDITFAQAKLIYQRAMEGKLSLSLPGKELQEGSVQDSNIYKLYMMVNYFDDPCDFASLFWDSEGGEAPGVYVDNSGSLYINKSLSTWSLSALNNAGITEAHITKYTDHSSSDGSDTYIPSAHGGQHDNLLIYNVSGKSSGFLSQKEIPFQKINLILGNVAGGGENPGNPEDASVYVLEIQPCDSYEFNTQSGREKLAVYLYGDKSKEKHLNITCVTPDTLNGMTADLAADYDLIYIGKNVDLFSESSIHAGYPYSHMGDIVRTSTLINGLRREDYITREAFMSLLPEGSSVNLSGDLNSSTDALWNENLKELWKDETAAHYFLRNMSLVPVLEAGNTSAGEARFSGNDLADSMREQLSQFIKKDMPVVVAGQVLDIAQNVKTDLDNKGNKPVSSADANIYQVLAENLEDHKDNIYREPDSTVHIANMELPANRPEVEIHFDGNDTISPVKPDNDEEEKELITLERSNTLSFSYAADAAAKITLMIDVNGDGMFGESKGTSSGSVGTPEDKPKDLPGDYIYQLPTNSGDVSVDISSLGLDDEVYQFQLTAESGKLKSRDRGYFRPVCQKRDIKVLQVTADGGSQWELSSNTRFMELLRAVTAEDDSTEYGNIEFVTKTCEDISDDGSGLSLDDYDLIIFGMGFDSDELLNGNTDITDTGAVGKLREYIEKEKRPVIFTNDSMSYVNSLNYMAPKKERYIWKQMTVGEYNTFTDNGTKSLTDDGINYRRTVYQANIPAENAAAQAIIDANGKVTNQNDKIYIGEGKESMAGYRRVIAPLPQSVSDGRQELSYSLGVEWGSISFGTYDVPDKNGTPRAISLGRLYVLFNEQGYKTDTNSAEAWIAPLNYRYLIRGPVTTEEFQASINDNRIVSLAVREGWGSKNYDFYFKDVYNTFVSYDQIIPENRIDDSSAPVLTIDGKDYYTYDGKYLAVYNNDTTEVDYWETWEYAVKAADGSEGAEAGKQSYTLLPVAGNDKALYPDKTDWNYYLTQSFRNTLGMDRFGITITEAERKNQDKDLGSVRYRNDKKNDGVWDDFEKKQLQGFTDAALLEYATTGDGWSQSTPFGSTESGFRYGEKNRTARIEQLNPGVIGQYPYEIEADKFGLTEIKEAHAPYYELSLNRRSRKDTGDVTVWYTLAGTPEGPDGESWTESSRYFSRARKNASGNYYLYSKGNIFYTGFSVYKDGSGVEGDKQDSEMKLFINTIFAALKTADHRRDETIYTVVQENSNTGAIAISKEAGKNSRYVYYYDEDDTEADIYFCMEKDGALNETTALRIGVTEESEGGEEFRELAQTSYTLTLPSQGTEADKGAFPLVPFPGEGTGPEWALLHLTWESGNSSQWDGKTLEIQVMTGSGADGAKNPKGVHAEILMVCREMFDLD